MSKRASKNDRRLEGGQFVALPQTVLNSVAMGMLTPHGVKLLIDVMAQYRWTNNGSLSTSWTLMKGRGWRSQDTLQKAKRELLASGLMVETRKGRRPNLASLYALSWLELDYDPSKHEVGPRSYERNAWKKPQKQVPITTYPRAQKQNAYTPIGVKGDPTATPCV